MTLLFEPPHSASPTDHLRPTDSSARRARVSSLHRPVIAAIRRLDDVEEAVTTPVRRRIDQMLRDALARDLESSGADGEGPAAAVPAVRVACAHLAAGDLEDAYLALLTARDLLR